MKRTLKINIDDIPMVRWFKKAGAWFTVQVLDRIFVKAPPVRQNANKARVFDELLRYAIELGPEVNLNYVCAYPKHEFLSYLASKYNLVLHGSNDPNLDILKPDKLYKANGYPDTVLRATQDGIEPIFYAVLDKARAGGVRNDCFVVKGADTEQRYYYFSVNDNVDPLAWTQGTVYILLRGAFTPEPGKPLHPMSWRSDKSIYPLTRIKVTPEDFPFRDAVAHHKDGEPALKSWIQYRQRLRN